MGSGLCKSVPYYFLMFLPSFFPPSRSFTGGWASLESACGVLESVYVQQQQPGSKWSHDHRELQCPRNSWSEKYNFHSQALKKKKSLNSERVVFSITCFFWSCSKYVWAHYDSWPADEQDPIFQLSLPAHEERNSQCNHSKVCLNPISFYQCCLSRSELTIMNIHQVF